MLIGLSYGKLIEKQRLDKFSFLSTPLKKSTFQISSEIQIESGQRINWLAMGSKKNSDVKEHETKNQNRTNKWKKNRLGAMMDGQNFL